MDKLEEFENKIHSYDKLYIINYSSLSIFDKEYKCIQPFHLSIYKSISNPVTVDEVLNINKGILLKNGYKLECIIVTVKDNEYILLKNDDYQFVTLYNYKGILIYL